MTKEKNGAVIHRSWIDSFLAGFLLLMQNCMRIPRLFADRDDIRIRYDIASSVKTKHNPPMVQQIVLAKFKFRLLCSSMLLYQVYIKLLTTKSDTNYTVMVAVAHGQGDVLYSGAFVMELSLLIGGAPDRRGSGSGFDSGNSKCNDNSCWYTGLLNNSVQ